MFNKVSKIKFSLLLPLLLVALGSFLLTLSTQLDFSKILLSLGGAGRVDGVYSDFNSGIIDVENKIQMAAASDCYYWPFDDGQGTVVTDISGNGANGTLSDVTKWVSGSSAKYGSAIYFGSTNRVDISTAAIPTTNYTFSAWVKITGYGWQPTFYFMGNQSGCGKTGQSSAQQFGLENREAGYLYNKKLYYAVGCGTFLYGRSTIDLNIWYHMALTVDSSRMTTMYVNGVIDSTPADSSQGQALASAYKLIGSYFVGGPYADMNAGVIDDVRVYKRVLTAAEIATLATTAPAGLPSSLICYTLPPTTPTGLTATTGSCVSDGSGNGKINLSWNAVTGATGYYIYRSTAVGGTYTNLTPSGYTSGTTYTDITPSASTTYYYEVVAYNTGGNSGYTTPVSAVSSGACIDLTCYYWPFDDGQGAVVTDVSGNGANGTLTDVTKWVSGPNAKYGNAINFDSTDYVNVGAAVLTTTNYTFSAWVKMTGYGWQPTFYFLGNQAGCGMTGTASAQHFGLENREAGYPYNKKLYYFVGCGDFLYGQSTVNLNTWYHLALTVDSSKVATMYLNGVIDSTPANASRGQALANAYKLIGGYISAGSYVPMNAGILDDVRVYKRVLTASEIATLAAVSPYSLPSNLICGGPTEPPPPPPPSVPPPEYEPFCSAAPTNIFVGQSSTWSINGIRQTLWPESDGSLKEWQPVSGTNHASLINESIKQPSAPDQANLDTYVVSMDQLCADTDGQNTMRSDEYVMVAPLANAPVKSLTVWASGIEMGSASQGIWASVFVNGSWSVEKAISFSGNSWGSAVFDSGGGPMNINNLKVKLISRGDCVVDAASQDYFQHRVNTMYVDTVLHSSAYNQLNYSWSGTDNLSGAGISLVKTYNSSGTKTAQVTITSVTPNISHNCDNNVVVNDNGGEFVPPDNEINGWIWSDDYGWISLTIKNTLPNCAWDATSPDYCSNYYSAGINNDNTILGYGWSNNVGWVCFGSTCGQRPDGTDSSAQIDQTTKKVTGWAKVISLQDDGWISLRGQSVSGEYYGQVCYDCQPHCEVSRENCVGDPLVCTTECISYSNVDFDSCNTCFTRTQFDQTWVPSTEEGVTGGNGNICTTECTGYNAVGEDQYCHKVSSVDGASYRIVCPKCSSCDQYGVNLVTELNRLVGWGWDGNVSAGGWFDGAGWVHFNPGTNRLASPWLETKYGPIYTPLAVRQKTEVGGNNATYCIFANSIELVSSSDCSDGFINNLNNDINIIFPRQIGASGVYYNALGKIDVDGLTTPVYGIINKYGQSIEELPGLLGGSQVLNNKIYYQNGDLTVSTLVFENAIGKQKGNGTVIVNGNLIITGDVTYSNIEAGNLKQLASVAWIVKGDIIIDPNVSYVVGTFIALGNAEIDNCTVDGAKTSNTAYPHYSVTGCGAFFSGNSANPLTVNGLIIAKAFDFERTFSSVIRGSEKIIYDGRFIANPPPGLGGFAEGLPVIRDFTY